MMQKKKNNYNKDMHESKYNKNKSKKSRTDKNSRKILEIIFSLIVVIMIAFFSQNEAINNSSNGNTNLSGDSSFSTNISSNTQNDLNTNLNENSNENINNSNTSANATENVNVKTNTNAKVNENSSTNINSTENLQEQNGYKTIVVGNGDVNSEKSLHVYYIDVGQADSILITNEGHSALIDAGNNEDGTDVVNFIKDKGITKLDYAIGTHPHEDHIGGMDDVINSFDIDKIYLPQIQTNTKTFEDVMKAISNKNKKIDSFKKGDKFNIGEAEVEVMTDSILDKTNLNLSSNILRMTFNGTSFLFTGDAETENEEAIDNWEQTDFLKVGHHGSNTSSSQKFLNKIKPKYAIISVGKDNDYGHPHKKILNRLRNIGATILRTDESGTIQVIVTPNIET